MKVVFKLSSCLLIAIISVVMVLNFRSLKAEAQIEIPVVDGELPYSLLTNTLYLPLVSHSADFIYGIYPDPASYIANISQINNLGISWVRFQMP